MLTDNDTAFAEKLRLIEDARSSIDMMYFVFHIDHTSSVLAKALLAAVERGVDVRMLIDYSTNYKNLDFFTMLEKKATASPGSLQVRFYNRPTRRIVEDAVYLTIGCSDVGGEEGAQRRDCDEEKLDFIDRTFANEDVEHASGLVSNLDLGYSGLFLSGVYSQHPGTMARAIFEGQDLDLDDLKGQVTGQPGKSTKKILRAYWRSRNGSLFSRMVNKLKLGLTYLIHGSEFRELQDTIGSLLPIAKSTERGGWRDWEFRSDYLHQKFLLVDGDRILTGGRNIGDSYHLHDPRRSGHTLLGKHVLFTDTEIYLESAKDQDSEFRAFFDRLWDFREMVADTSEIRQHAPNDFIANLRLAEQTCKETLTDQHEACIDAELETVLSIKEREDAHHENVQQLAEIYHRDYQPATDADRSPSFEVDTTVRAYYLENLPFDKDVAASDRKRLFGASGLKEEASGKYLHLLWRRGMTNACLTSSAEAPKRVILLNPYYLPPSTLLRAAGWMLDGTLDCRHVTVQVLTNSHATNDFKAVNPLGHISLKAFSEFYQQQGDPEKRAEFDFYEYRERPGVNFAVHSKVSLLGDDLIIGSANLEPRSFLMDSNNGFLLRNAPGLRDSFTKFLDQQLEDSDILEHIDGYLRSTPLDEMKAEKLRLLSDFVASAVGEETLSPEQQAQVNTLLNLLLDQVYQLTHRILQGDEEAIEAYNRLLKLI